MLFRSGNGVTVIGHSAFYGCQSLENLTIGSSVTRIGDMTFCECPKLTSLVIPDGVEHIGFSAFRECAALKTVVISNSRTNMDGWVFYLCDDRIEVYYAGTAKDLASTTMDMEYKLLTPLAEVYYYTEAKPAEAGNYWHYVDGVPTKW